MKLIMGRFFGSFLQRAAKMKQSLGGGTLTLFGVLPGMPATGAGDAASAIPGYSLCSGCLPSALITSAHNPAVDSHQLLDTTEH